MSFMKLNSSLHYNGNGTVNIPSTVSYFAGYVLPLVFTNNRAYNPLERWIIGKTGCFSWKNIILKK